MSFTKPLLLVAAALLLIAPARAQDAGEPALSAADGKLVLDVPEQRLAMPMPDWLNAGDVGSGDIKPLVDLSYSVENGQIRLDIRPKGETEADWKIAYGAHLQEQTSGTLVGFRRSVMAGYGQSCQPNAMAFFQFGRDDGDNLAPLGFACGAFFDGSGRSFWPWRDRRDELPQKRQGRCRVLPDWRGPAFDPSKPASWPVATNVVEERSRQLQAEVSLTLAD
ncbi:hypothetical protein N8D56_02695 [Devosia sp. A8/3-2]|nr:hypothetical protein N8D56_02695 [Devosia sp. A8/3-2]